MTKDQQRKILEAAAKACGIDLKYDTFGQGSNADREYNYWNPLIDSLNTASMCAKLDINHTSMDGYVKCWQWNKPPVRIEHDGTDAGKEAAWRLASSIVAAKIGGYTE